MVKVTNYSQPRKINPVSLIVYVLIAGLLYGAWQFGPPYYRKFKAKETLGETANAIYPKRMLQGPDELEFLSQLELSTLAKLREIGITDPGLKLYLRKTSGEIVAEARYLELIKHPLVSKTTTLSFNPIQTVKIEKQ